jgi:type II secretory pathway component GspD/PulD (secretin)
MRHRSIDHPRSVVRFRHRVLGLQPLLALVFTLTASGQAAPSTPPQPTSAVSDPALHSLPTQLELARLLDLAASRLGINLEYDPATLTGSVTLRTEAGLSDAALWELANSVLASRGMTTVRHPQSGVYRVVKLADASSVAPIGPPSSSDLDSSIPLSGYGTLVVAIRHRPARDLVEPISRLLSKPGGSVVPVTSGTGGSVGGAGSEGSGSDSLLLISDLSTRLQQITALLPLLDTPGPKAEIREIPIINTSIERVVTAFAQMNARRDAITGTKSTGDLIAAPNGTSVLLLAPAEQIESLLTLVALCDQREATQSITYTPRFHDPQSVASLIDQSVRPAGDERWRAIVDTLTQSIIITATPTEHARIAELMARLDDVPEASRRSLRTFTLRNRSVIEIQGILAQMLASGIIGDDSVQDELGGDGSDASRQTSLRPSTPGASAPTSTGTSPLEQRVGTASRPGAIGSQRRASDSSGPDVQLSIDEGTNTLIVVAEPRVTQQIEDLIRQLDVRQSQVMLEVLIVTLTEGQTLDLGVELEDIKIDGQTRLRLASLFGLATRGSDGSVSTGNAAGFSAVVLNPGDFSVVIRALQTINAGRAQSMPKLLVGNNQQATLDSVLQQPFASVNASNTVSTTSFGGTQDAGTTVTIKPQIAEGDHLVLDYSVSLSSFLGSASQPTLPPPRQQNRIRSVATIPDGHTVVVGGIELENDSKTTAQVPLLGQIPIIGEAFKSRGKTTNRTRFYVFIRATVLRGRGFEDLRYLSTQDMAEAGIDDGWPTSTPRVIR